MNLGEDSEWGDSEQRDSKWGDSERGDSEQGDSDYFTHQSFLV